MASPLSGEKRGERGWAGAVPGKGWEHKGRRVNNHRHQRPHDMCDLFESKEFTNQKSKKTTPEKKERGSKALHEENTLIV